MAMKQPWELVGPHWKRVFLHESGHALMAVRQGVTCYGVAYRSDKDTAFTSVPPLPTQKTEAHRLFLGAGSAAEATKYSGMSFYGAKDDRKQHGGTPAQFNQSVEVAYNILLTELETLKAFDTVLLRRGGNRGRVRIEMKISVGIRSAPPEPIGDIPEWDTQFFQGGLPSLGKRRP